LLKTVTKNKRTQPFYSDYTGRSADSFYEHTIKI